MENHASMIMRCDMWKLSQLFIIFRNLAVVFSLMIVLPHGAMAASKPKPLPDIGIDEGDELYKRGHYEKAVDWWKDAAQKGSVNAQYRLGAAYNDGVARAKEVIVPQDFKEAAKWLIQAAEQGDERAQFDLAALYDNGLGVEKSHTEAARWYLAGAQRGQVACQYNIAVMYEDGIGVQKDLVEAYKWYYLAAQQGFVEFGGPALEKLGRQLQPAQVRSAIQMAKVMKPIPPVR
jgi:uncharacterized protein